MTGRRLESSVSSFDQLQSSGSDRTLSGRASDSGCLRSVNSREVPERLLLDRTHLVGTDRTLGCLSPVDSSKVPEWVFVDRTRPVGADRTLVRVQSELKDSFLHSGGYN